jgi:hypothetical protein
MFTKDTPTTDLSWRYVLGEIQELWEEAINLNFKGMVNEFCDVYTGAMCAITTHTGINVPIFWMRSADGWMERMEFFRKYLTEIGLEFKVEYLRYGANYEREWKRRKVVELAVKDQLNIDL